MTLSPTKKNALQKAQECFRTVNFHPSAQKFRIKRIDDQNFYDGTRQWTARDLQTLAMREQLPITVNICKSYVDAPVLYYLNEYVFRFNPVMVNFSCFREKFFIRCIRPMAAFKPYSKSSRKNLRLSYPQIKEPQSNEQTFIPAYPVEVQ